MGFDTDASILEDKIKKVEAMTDASIKKLEKKCNEELEKMDISDEDKCKIANLDDIASELEETINL